MPACVMLKLRPAIVRVADREDVELFAATE
jgi:hypothetical protein